MTYLEFYNALKNFTVFSLNDIRRVEEYFYRPRLVEWQKKGYIKKLINGYYIFSDVPLDEGALFEISNRIYSPSYVSLQMALSYHGLIPESIYGVTAVSTRRTYQFQTPIANFSYRTIKTDMFFGYDLIEHRGKCFKMASAEKALIDYLYLNPHLDSKEDFEGMRINVDSFKEVVHKKTIQEYAIKSGHTWLTQRVKLFLEVVRHA